MDTSPLFFSHAICGCFAPHPPPHTAPYSWDSRTHDPRACSSQPAFALHFADLYTMVCMACSVALRFTYAAPRYNLTTFTAMLPHPTPTFLPPLPPAIAPRHGRLQLVCRAGLALGWVLLLQLSIRRAARTHTLYPFTNAATLLPDTAPF